MRIVRYVLCVFITILLTGSALALERADTSLAPAGNAKDQAAAINQAIQRAALRGGGIVHINGPGQVSLRTSILLRSNVVLMADPGAAIVWIGTDDLPVVSTSPNEVVHGCGVEGLRIHSQNAQTVFELHSIFGCRFQDIEILGASPTTTHFRLLADSRAGEYPPGTGKRNSAANSFYNIRSVGECGTFFLLAGLKESGPPQVVTLNTFSNLFAWGCHKRGIDFSRWADNNAFTGVTRVNIVGDGGIGVEFNSSDPSRETGVYSNTFEHLAVDNFGNRRGRIGVKFNVTKLNQIFHLFNDPSAEAGSVVASEKTQSYLVRLKRPGGADFITESRGFTN